MWNLWGFPNLERQIQSLCDGCVVTGVIIASHNFSAKRLTSTLTRAPTRATACGNRAAQMWNIWGFPNLEREIQSSCDVCVVTTVSIASRNFSATR